MKKELLEAYDTLLQTGTTQGAAVRLGVSQSAISRRISQLEERLGVSLFLREKSRLVPTPASAALQNDIFRLLENIRRLDKQAHAIGSGNFASVSLRVAFPGSLGLTVVPRIAAQFMAENQDVRLEILNGPYDTIERMLLDDRAEVGFLRLPVGRPGLNTTPAIASRTVCAMPLDHPLARKDVIKISDLRTVSLVLLGWRRAPRRELDEAFWRAGFQPLIRIETHSVLSACGLVASGLGVSLVNELMAADYTNLPICFRPLAEHIPHYFAFATAKQEQISTSAEKFMATAATVLKSLHVG